MPTRNAQAEWKHGLKEGEGRIQFTGGDFDKPYSFSARFEQGEGTNPEELIAAAHAGCFSMALAAALEKAGQAPNKISTEAKVTVEEVDGEPTITGIQLETDVTVSGFEDDQFQDIAKAAKKDCPVSKALAGVDIQLTANKS